jgi:hypothetical protein
MNRTFMLAALLVLFLTAPAWGKMLERSCDSQFGTVVYDGRPNWHFDTRNVAGTIPYPVYDRQLMEKNAATLARVIGEKTGVLVLYAKLRKDDEGDYVCFYFIDRNKASPRRK